MAAVDDICVRRQRVAELLMQAHYPNSYEFRLMKNVRCCSDRANFVARMNCFLFLCVCNCFVSHYVLRES